MVNKQPNCAYKPQTTNTCNVPNKRTGFCGKCPLKHFDRDLNLFTTSMTRHFEQLQWRNCIIHIYTDTWHWYYVIDHQPYIYSSNRFYVQHTYIYKCAGCHGNNSTTQLYSTLKWTKTKSTTSKQNLSKKTDVKPLCKIGYIIDI